MEDKRASESHGAQDKGGEAERSETTLELGAVENALVAVLAILKINDENKAADSKVTRQHKAFMEEVDRVIQSLTGDCRRRVAASLNMSNENNMRKLAEELKTDAVQSQNPVSSSEQPSLQGRRSNAQQIDSQHITDKPS